ncbi:uncharacterized protein LY79DRAFT_49639 [Colletotrichum navitas]|uniref:Uncharacterized protein n=1 Tax=Colletotrichum navitas TaxID=681940 RepID=A0AAD8Q6H3_9PEZI|nr:uncharacterized protein LY79DRAFT_49639 [Colletotrichum navitas]KAK1596620.1 hypothetical protein LY79DRAFT_49639 [Colletotrichum navitas]
MAKPTTPSFPRCFSHFPAASPLLRYWLVGILSILTRSLKSEKSPGWMSQVGIVAANPQTRVAPNTASSLGSTHILFYPFFFFFSFFSFFAFLSTFFFFLLFPSLSLNSNPPLCRSLSPVAKCNAVPLSFRATRGR